MDGSHLSTLVLEDVSTHSGAGPGLRNVSLDVDEGEVVGVWGRRRSGRSTLARVVAGIERPDTGTVRVAGRDLVRVRDARQLVAVWHARFPADHGRSVSRHVAIAARRGRRPAEEVCAEASAALVRVGAGDCADAAPHELDRNEVVRVGLARALVMRPKAIVLDEPLSGLGVLDAQRVLELLIRIAREDRIAMLVTASEVAQLGGVDRNLSIADGVLRGATTPLPAEVLRLRGA